jgi:hypothetical protein
MPPTNTSPGSPLDRPAAGLRFGAGGERRPFTATVQDVSGAPVQGVQVRFDESGAGAS